LERSSAIAADLEAQCGGPGGSVAILPGSGSRTLESILGALLGGFAYFCADPSAPASHVDDQLAAVKPVAVLRNGIISELRPHRAQPNDMAALYATSGTTGAPRIVALSHRAILFDIGRQTNDLYLGPDDRFDLLFSFAFSASLAPMFGALLNGGQVHLFDARYRLPDLGHWLGEHRITVSTMSVSALRTLCQAETPITCPDLRLLSASGERLLASDVAAFRAVFPRPCVLQNALAATETLRSTAIHWSCTRT
jgi:non-ribosomal peptide synthetase component F